MKECSFGVIPFRRAGSSWEVFLVQLHAGHWGFPKGHPLDEEESPFSCACRELEEEAGLRVSRLLALEPFVEHYTFDKDGVSVDKEVVYFLAEVEGEENLQDEEVSRAAWVPLSDVEDALTFPDLKALWSEVVKQVS